MICQIDAIHLGNQLDNMHERKFIDVADFQRQYELSLNQANDILRRALTVMGYTFPEPDKRYVPRVIVLDYSDEKGNFVALLQDYDRDHVFYKFAQQVVPRMSIEASFTFEAKPREGFVAIDGKQYEINALRKALQMLDEGLISG